jgi:hypothetical protein
MGYGEASDIHELKNALWSRFCGLTSHQDQHETMKGEERTGAVLVA